MPDRHSVAGVPCFSRLLSYLFFRNIYINCCPERSLTLISYHGAFMAKFMLSLREENFQLLSTEAIERGITVQELIRAVIIPDWVKLSNPERNSRDQILPGNGNGNGREQLVQPLGVKRYGVTYSR